MLPLERESDPDDEDELPLPSLLLPVPEDEEVWDEGEEEGDGLLRERCWDLEDVLTGDLRLGL